MYYSERTHKNLEKTRFLIFWVLNFFKPFSLFSCSECDTLFNSQMDLEHHKEALQHWSEEEDDEEDDDDSDTDYENYYGNTMKNFAASNMDLHHL